MTTPSTPEGEALRIRGQLERITYANEANGYSVFKIGVAGHRDLVTAVGFCSPRMPGEELELSGRWVNHPKFGLQFQFSSCRSLLPSTVEGIRRYLGSGLVKGVGPQIAKRIVETFGERSLDVLDETPDELLSVRGISDRLLASIKQSWEAQKEVRSVMFFLQTNGVSPRFAAKIFAEYGQHTIQVVRENPYRLADDIFGIGFLSADRFASSIGVEPTSPMRMDAGVLYTLSEFSAEGHVYVPRRLLASRAAELLSVEESMTDEAIARLVADFRVVLERIVPDGDDPAEVVYLPPYYIAEHNGARKLSELIRPDSPVEDPRFADSPRAIEWIEAQMKIELARNQKAALALAMRSKSMIVTGGPGTGKTTLIRAIIGIFGSIGYRIELAAPTGRAAKRMAEATGHEAKTIHRMLEYNPKEGAFARNADSPLECDLLIVDEASMVDIILMYHLLRAIPKGAKLILVGDVHQLPSVGPGNVLKDLIHSGKIPMAELNEIFRQARESLIVVNAHRVNSGLLPEEPDDAGGLRDFYFQRQEEPERCVETILSIVTDRIPARFGLDPVRDVQVLSPMHRGTLGAFHLNEALQGVLNPDRGESIERGGRIFRKGDKIMQIRNNYDKDVYNGDIGFVCSVDPEAGLLTAEIDGRRILYGAEEFDELTLAYAVSIHKSQGSEYPAVVIPVHTQHYVMLQRNLLYTGITRGKRLVVLVGTKKALSIAVKNDDTKRRYTYLGERLSAAVTW